jgi:hypothetical protein
VKHRRILIPLAVAGAIAATAPSAAVAQEPSENACWGQFISFSARLTPPEFRNFGEVVSGLAHEPGPLGRTAVPTFKAFACGGEG